MISVVIFGWDGAEGIENRARGVYEGVMKITRIWQKGVIGGQDGLRRGHDVRLILSF